MNARGKSLEVIFGHFVLIGVAALLVGCSTYESGFEYEPEIIELAAGGGERRGASGGLVRTLVSVAGVRREDKETDTPRSVEIRFRIMNESDSVAVTLLEDSLALITADLERFPEPVITAESGLTVPPGHDRPLIALFPFPEPSEGGLDLDGLNVRWSLVIDGEELSQSATFSRVRYDAAFDEPRTHIGVGVGYHH